MPPMTEYVKLPRFDEYKEWFKEHIIMERKEGILSMRFHTKNKSPSWSLQAHNAIANAFKIVGMDKENEVLIWSSTPPYWLASADPEGFNDIVEHELDYVYRDAIRQNEGPIFDLEIPTIGVITGPGGHWDTPLYMDITLCADNMVFSDTHFFNTPPGDGMGLILQHLLGTKRAAYLLYTLSEFDAKTALEWGFVNELLPTDKLMDRAWEIARAIMKSPRPCRRLTSQIVKRPWKDVLVRDMQMHIATECYGRSLAGGWGDHIVGQNPETDAQMEELMGRFKKQATVKE